MTNLSTRLTTVLLFALLLPFHASAQKMVKKQRVTTIWNRYYYKDSVDMSDSMRFYYSGTRGSVFNPFTYNPLGLFERDYGYNIQLAPEHLALQDISPAFSERSAIMVAFDSVYEYARYGHVYGLELKERTYATYNANNNLILIQQKQIYNQQHTIARDNNDLAFFVKFEQFDSTRNSWQEKMRRNILYSSDMAPAADTTYYNWPPQPNYTDLAASYTYDNAGRLASEKRQRRRGNDWGDYEEYLYTYDGQGRVIKRKRMEDWHVDEVIHLFYDNAGRISRVVNTPTDDINFYPTETILTYDANGNATGLDRIDPSGISGVGKYETRFYYNSYQNPDSAITKTYDTDGKPLPRHYRTYYSYEIHDAPDTLGAKSISIVVYPNPARSRFNIRWNDQRPSKPVYITLYSTIGQRVFQKYISKASVTEAVQIGGLESGVYHLRIVTESGEELHVSKLVVQQ